MAECRRWLGLCDTPLHTSSRVRHALPYMEASITDTRAYEAATSSVEIVESILVLIRPWFMSVDEGWLWTCRYSSVSSDRLVALQIERQELSGHVSIAVIGRYDEASPQCHHPIESE